MKGHRIDGYLEAKTVDNVRRMANIWGAKTPMRKAQYLEAILSGINNREKVREVLASLSVAERNALAVIKRSNGEIGVKALPITLAALGTPLPVGNTYGYSSDHGMNRLMERGLIFPVDPDRSSYGHFDSYASFAVTADERLLAAVGEVEAQPVRLDPCQIPSASMFRRPATVLLDLVGLLQSIGELGGLILTKAGEIRATSLRKLEARMGREKHHPDGFAMPEPHIALSHALYAAGLLIEEQDRLVVGGSPEEVTEIPLAQLVVALSSGFVDMTAWFELEEIPRGYYAFGFSSHAPEGRSALLIALSRLPADSRDFVSIADFSEALFERIGEIFCLGYLPSRPDRFVVSPQKGIDPNKQWREELREEWSKREYPWIIGVFTTWLYYLGLVEVGMENGAPVSVRLTDLGLSVFHPGLASTSDAATQSGVDAWVVQPNMEIVVYLDRVNPAQLSFLGRVAERGQIQQHTAHYRLTRATVYRGLESGLTAPEITERLQEGTSRSLPQNIVVHIQEWAALVEEITLRQQVDILEFADEQSRKNAIHQGLKGQEAGDRFLVLPDARRKPSGVAVHYDYSGPPVRCLSVDEDGQVSLTGPRDLLISAQLDQWAERLNDTTWRLTAESVSTAAMPKSRIKALLKLLNDRALKPVPQWTISALQAWAGTAHRVELVDVVLLRCGNPELLDAILKSKRLRPSLAGTLAPDILLIHRAQAAALKEHLIWAGFAVEEIIRME